MRRPKPFEKMAVDPQLPYQMGQLVGAAFMAGTLLTQQEKPDAIVIGNNLLSAVGWFFEGSTVSKPEGRG